MSELSTTKEKIEINRYPWYKARFWDGMRIGTWWKLLHQNRFAFSPTRFPTASLTFIANPINSLCSRWQAFRWQQEIERVSIDQSPLFVLGHWRSGTTLLQELLTLDARHAFANTYDCFAPTHFLSTRSFMSRWFRFLVPQQRPMDNMLAGWGRPQEEEFALLNMGLPTIYRTVAFPNHGPVDLDSLDFAGYREEEIEKWKAGLMWFLQRVYFRERRPLVLKSPPHLGRIRVLLELFPKARFVHIVRDPYAVYPSAVRLWKSLFETQSVQVPSYEWLDEFVFDVFLRLYRQFEQTRSLIPAAQYAEIHYEELVKNPVASMEQIYGNLGLTDCQSLLPQIREYFSAQEGYRTHRHELDERTRDQINERWADYMQCYGYSRLR